MPHHTSAYITAYVSLWVLETTPRLPAYLLLHIMLPCAFLRQHTSQHTSACGFWRQCHVCLASFCCMCVLVLSYICVLILSVLIQADPARFWFLETGTQFTCFTGTTVQILTQVVSRDSGTDAVLLVHDYAHTLRVAWVVEV
jgi:hypothetical protein